jgi:ADP-ribose pyrophosphatase YjhB (NUDIX family)
MRRFCPKCRSEKIEDFERGRRVYHRCLSCGATSEWLIVDDPKLVWDKTKDGKIRHYSVGALIKRKDKFLLFERKRSPFGFTVVAGHLEKGEDPIHAMKREIKEESGLAATGLRLVFEGDIKGDLCSKGAPIHYWRLYSCKVKGRVKTSSEAIKKPEWFTKEEIKRLPLTYATGYLFKKVGIV